MQDKDQEIPRDRKHKKSHSPSGDTSREEQEVREEETISGTVPGSRSEISSGAERELQRLLRELEEVKSRD